VLVSGGRVMRYGCYNSRAPALLAGGVVAGPDGCLLVAPSRFADASFALHLGAVGRAVALPPITTSADDHQPVAAPAVEHPVAFLDGQAPATEGWTKRPPPAILSSLTVVLSLWRWHRSPDCYANGLGFVLSVEALFYRTDWQPVTWASVAPAMGGAVMRSLLARCREERDPGLEPHPRQADGENQLRGTRPRGTRITVYPARAGRATPREPPPRDEPDPLACGRRRKTTRSRRKSDPPGLRRGERTTSTASARGEPEPSLQLKPPENRAFKPPRTPPSSQNAKDCLSRAIPGTHHRKSSTRYGT